jgi:hypothetical protein
MGQKYPGRLLPVNVSVGNPPTTPILYIVRCVPSPVICAGMGCTVVSQSPRFVYRGKLREKGNSSVGWSPGPSRAPSQNTPVSDSSVNVLATIAIHKLCDEVRNASLRQPLNHHCTYYVDRVTG